MVRDEFSEAFGVKNRLFRYGRDIRCAKQPPVVREAFSETFGDKKGLMGHATHLQRSAKQPPAPPNAFSKAQNITCHIERIFKGVPCQKQPPATPDAFSVRETAPLSLFAPAAPSLAPSTALGTRDAHRSEVSRHKKRMYSLEKS